MTPALNICHLYYIPTHPIQLDSFVMSSGSCMMNSSHSQAEVDPESCVGVGGGGANYGERENASLYGGLGTCPQWGPGAKPLVRGPGERSPPEADAFLYF